MSLLASTNFISPLLRRMAGIIKAMSACRFLDPGLDLFEARDPARARDLAVDHQPRRAEDVELHDLFDVRDLLPVRGEPELGPGVEGPFLDLVAARAARSQHDDLHFMPPLNDFDSSATTPRPSRPGRP